MLIIPQFWAGSTFMASASDPSFIFIPFRFITFNKHSAPPFNYNFEYKTTDVECMKQWVQMQYNWSAISFTMIVSEQFLIQLFWFLWYTAFICSSFFILPLSAQIHMGRSTVCIFMTVDPTRFSHFFTLVDWELEQLQPLSSKVDFVVWVQVGLV